MTETNGGIEIPRVGTLMGTIMAGDWANIPASSDTERRMIALNTQNAIKKVVIAALWEYKRVMVEKEVVVATDDSHKQTNVKLLAVPPFGPEETNEARAAAVAIKDGWQIQLGVMGTRNPIVPHIPTLVMNERFAL